MVIKKINHLGIARPTNNSATILPNPNNKAGRKCTVCFVEEVEV
jgi:hypothetical protein